MSNCFLQQSIKADTEIIYLHVHRNYTHITEVVSRILAIHGQWNKCLLFKLFPFHKSLHKSLQTIAVRKAIHKKKQQDRDVEDRGGKYKSSIASMYVLHRDNILHHCFYPQGYQTFYKHHITSKSTGQIFFFFHYSKYAVPFSHIQAVFQCTNITDVVAITTFFSLDCKNV